MSFTGVNNKTTTGGKNVERSESVDNTCPVCHDVIEVYAIGPCDHRVCYRCSTRMRVLCETMDCPICRSLMPQVAFVREKLQFTDVSLRDCIPNRKYKIFFQDETVEDRYLDLLEFNCRLCRNINSFRTFAQLQTHMRKDHQLFACDLCVSYLKIFPFERKFYSRKNLALHRRVGDPDDTSYKGHPLCEFCDSRYNDKDELMKHLRKDHYFCHFCDQQGSNAYYDQYPDLMKHFSESHYLCTEGECSSPSTRFTHAFDSEIDLKAHKASAHNKNLSKAQSREARTIEVDFQLPPRRQGNNSRGGDGNQDSRGGGRGRGHDRFNKRRERVDEDLQRAIDASMEPSEARPPVEERVPDPINDFPSLNGGPPVNTFTPAYVTAASVPRVEDFPSLSSTAPARPIRTAPQPTKAYSKVMNFHDSQPAPAPAPSKETKPVSLGQVPNAFKERRSAAPRKTMEEYPSLGSNARAPPPSFDDYPSLGPSSNHGMPVSWGKPPQPTVSVVPNKPVFAPQASARRNTVKNISDENEFPTLGVGAARPQEPAFRNPLGQGWSNPPANKKKPTVVSKKEKVAEDFDLPDSYYKSYEPSPVSNGRSETESTDKAKTHTTKAPPPSLTSDFPSLPPRTQKDQKGGGVNEKKKKKQKKPEEKPEKSQKGKKDSKASLNDIALDLVKNESVVRENGVSSLRASKKTNPPKQLDWFDNPPPIVEEKKPPQPRQSAAAKSEEKPPVNNHFPSLHAMPASVQQAKPASVQQAKPPSVQQAKAASVQQAKPPPGFQADSPAAPTPPGFKPQPTTTNGTSTPPGFSGRAKPEKAAAAAAPAKDFTQSVYIQPPDFKPRNLQLIEDIRVSLETVYEGFPNFRALSGQFRQGLMEVSDYFYSCQTLMGEADFAKIFPELLGLLPDIPKQRELFDLYQVVMTSLDKWQRRQAKLLACPQCGQVVLDRDQQHHELSHGGDFPSLGQDSAQGGAPVTSMAASRKGSWIKAT